MVWPLFSSLRWRYRFVGLTRNAGAGDRAHVESICLRENHMLEAIRCISLGGCSTALPAAESTPPPAAPVPASSNTVGSGSGSGKAASFAFAETAPPPPPPPACTSAGFNKTNKAANGGGRRGKKSSETVSGWGARGTAVLSGVGGNGESNGESNGKGNGEGGGNGASIPASPTSDATAETYFSSEAPSSVATLSMGSLPEGAAAAAAAEGGGESASASASGSRSGSRPRRTALVLVSPGGGGGGGGGSPTFEIPSSPPSDAAAAAAAAAASAMGLEAMTLTESTAAATPPRVTGARASPSPTLQASPSSEITPVALPPPSPPAGSPFQRKGEGAERRQGPAVRGGGDVAAPTGGVGVVEESPWTKELPAKLSPAARRYAATYLATCVRQALQRNPDQMARCGWVVLGDRCRS